MYKRQVVFQPNNYDNNKLLYIWHLLGCLLVASLLMDWFSKVRAIPWRALGPVSYTHLRYFSCPHCRQQVRVPKGRGKISITCPKCGTQFIKKS